MELNCKSLATITTAVGKYVNSDDFEGIPPIDSASMLAQFRAYTWTSSLVKNIFSTIPLLGAMKTFLHALVILEGLPPCMSALGPLNSSIKNHENEPNHHVTMAAYLLRHISIPK